MQISAKDTEKVYSISIERFFRYAGTMNRGHGEQYFVSIAHWSVTANRLPGDIPSRGEDHLMAHKSHTEEAIQFKLL